MRIVQSGSGENGSRFLHSREQFDDVATIAFWCVMRSRLDAGPRRKSFRILIELRPDGAVVKDTFPRPPLSSADGGE
jgi:hypothetical protein